MRLRVVFFFSSRRRHTRCSRDWSSDVCSSDLEPHERAGGDALVSQQIVRHPQDEHVLEDEQEQCQDLRSEEHTSELQSRLHLVCRLLLEKKKKKTPV